MEVGSRNINGTIRDLLPHAEWWGIDVASGKDVDEVASGTTWKPSAPVDLAICCEVFEHTAEWRDIVTNMVSWLKPGGTILVTCAGPGRPEHSAVDGGRLHKGEWYENVTSEAMSELLTSLSVEAKVSEFSGDLYMVGTKL